MRQISIRWSGDGIFGGSTGGTRQITTPAAVDGLFEEGSALTRLTRHREPRNRNAGRRACLGANRRAAEDLLAEVWRVIIGDPRRVFLVAELDGEVVGTADVSIIPNVTHGARPAAFMERVVVDAQRRGRGISAALMDEVVAVAASAGGYKLTVPVDQAAVAGPRLLPETWLRANLGGISARPPPPRNGSGG